MATHLGDQIADARRRKGLSQRELADLLDRSESWVSQVERGVLPVERVALLRRIGDVLEIGILDLQPELGEPEQATTSRNTALDGLRHALTGHPALPPLLGQPIAPAGYKVLAAEVDLACAAALASDFDLLAEILPEVEAATRRARGEHRKRHLILLTRLYQAVSFSFAAEGEADAAWVAADRAIAAAEATTDPLQVIATHFRLAHTFIALDRDDQARHLIKRTITALHPLTKDNADHQTLALYGALHLVWAVLAGRNQDRQLARSSLDEAERIANIVGDDRNDFDTEFGITNVKLHRIAIALDLGDAGEALDVASTTNPEGLSTERQMRYHLDIARAHTQRRHVDQAVNALTTAAAIQPEAFRSHKLAHQVIHDLEPLATGHTKTTLDNLARPISALS